MALLLLLALATGRSPGASVLACLPLFDRSACKLALQGSLACCKATRRPLATLAIPLVGLVSCIQLLLPPACSLHLTSCPDALLYSSLEPRTKPAGSKHGLRRVATSIGASKRAASRPLPIHPLTLQRFTPISCSAGAASRELKDAGCPSGAAAGGWSSRARETLAALSAADEKDTTPQPLRPVLAYNQPA